MDWLKTVGEAHASNSNTPSPKPSIFCSRLLVPRSMRFSFSNTMSAHRILPVEISSSQCHLEGPLLLRSRAFGKTSNPLKSLAVSRVLRGEGILALKSSHRTSGNYRRFGLLVARSGSGDGDSSVSDQEVDHRVNHDGAIVVCDDLDAFLNVLPADVRDTLLKHPRRSELLEVVLDLGRRPEARFLGDGGGEFLRCEEVTREDLDAAQVSVGEFGGDNRAGIEGTLHRISAIRSRKGAIVGLTCRVGRAVTGHVDMARNLLHLGQSILFLGRPGVGKTTVIREIARVLADELRKRVVIVDTSNEIGGDGDVPHSAIGWARRMQVADPSMQHKVMVEAVENHMPEVVIVDEIGTEAEALACRTIAERGVMLVGTAHGQMLENIIKNPTLCDLVGGVHSVTLGDDEARARGTQKSVLERKAPSTFPLLIEMRERSHWVAHQTDRSVDSLLHGRRPIVEVRTRDENFKVVVERKMYDSLLTSKSDMEHEVNIGTAVLSMMGSFKLPSDESDDNTTWVSKLGFIHDKDAVAESSISYASKRITLEDYDEEYGVSSSGIPGKRGSKRGPRGIRPRNV